MLNPKQARADMILDGDRLPIPGRSWTRERLTECIARIGCEGVDAVLDHPGIRASEYKRAQAERFIADLLEVPTSEIWPERYKSKVPAARPDLVDALIAERVSRKQRRIEAGLPSHRRKARSDAGQPRPRMKARARRLWLTYLASWMADFRRKLLGHLPLARRTEARQAAIEAALTRKPIFAAIARELGLPEQHLWDVAAGKATSAHVRAAIVALLGRDPWARRKSAP